MRFLVTGGTGLLGNNVLRQLTDADHQSISLVRGRFDDRVFDGIDTEFVTGDLSSTDVIDDAVSRCDAVIHSAGLIHLGWTRLDESMHVNAVGTQEIAAACRRHDRKLVYVGTVNTMAVSEKGKTSDETTPLDFAGGQIPCSYVLSKRAGVDVVRTGVTIGLRAAIVHPAFMLGPWDWKPSSGKMVLEVGRVWRPLAPRGVNSVCDVRDVAAATIAAATTKVPNGREFILAGHNVSYKQLWNEIASRMGVRGPILRAGPLQLWGAGKFGDAKAKLTNREPEFNSASIAMANQVHAYDSSRAIHELGYQIRPLDQILDDAVAWLRANHLKPVGESTPLPSSEF